MVVASKNMSTANRNGKANDLATGKRKADDTVDDSSPLSRNRTEQDSPDRDQSKSAQSSASDSASNSASDSQAKPLAVVAKGLEEASRAEKTIEDSAGGNRAPELENLNKIRDILFGQQVQTHDQRFEQLERRLAEECADLRADFDRRMSSLESRLLNRLDSLTQRLQTEETARKDASVRLNQSITESERASERRASQLEGKINTVAHDLHTEIKHQTLTLKDSLEQQMYEILSELEKETSARKRSTEAERTQLSKLLGELSKQLESEA